MSAIVEHNVPFNPVRCTYCEHFSGNYKCKAFDNIPDEIIDGLETHENPLPGQKGSFVFKPEETARYEDVKNLLAKQHQMMVERSKE